MNKKTAFVLAGLLFALMLLAFLPAAGGGAGQATVGGIIKPPPICIACVPTPVPHWECKACEPTPTPRVDCLACLPDLPAENP